MNIKIKSTLIECLTITTKHGDAIKLILDETGNESGRATVVLYNSTGSYYWPSMGKPLKDFIIACPTSYLIDKLFGTESTLIDTDANALIEKIYTNHKQQLRRVLFVKDKKEREVNRDLIRYAFDYLKDNEATPDMLYHNENISNALSKIFGDDWYMLDIQPQKKNPIYTYQCEVIDCIKTALKQLLAAQKPA